jgi:hypothetical protein
VSSFAIRGERRVASSECPVSFVSGGSVALVELFAARKTLGHDGDLHATVSRVHAGAASISAIIWVMLGRAPGSTSSALVS